jgi:hypothetical protein
MSAMSPAVTVVRTGVKVPIHITYITRNFKHRKSIHEYLYLRSVNEIRVHQVFHVATHVQEWADPEGSVPPRPV